jgi:Transglycosylase-like domain
MRKLLPVAATLCLTIVPTALAQGSSTENRGASALAGAAPSAGTPALGSAAFDSLAPPARHEKVNLRRRAAERGVKVAKRADAKLDAVTQKREAAKQATKTPPQLQAIAACESGGDPSAVGGGGTYRGKYQFDQGTWASVGGSGDPAAAPEAEQDKRAAMLYERTGPGQWPVCGQ